jgi:hypothetical protein
VAYFLPFHSFCSLHSPVQYPQGRLNYPSIQGFTSFPFLKQGI